jgi:centromere-localized protein 2
VPQPHILSSVLPALESAVDDLSEEIQSLEADAEALLASIKATVSGMSDLRYGKLSNGRLNQDVIESLHGLDSTCAER